MNAKQIIVSDLKTDDILNVALRSVSRHWLLPYSKLMTMNFEWCSDTPYGATDGRTLFLNQSGVAKLASKPNGSGLLAFLLVHEALHALLGHCWRVESLKDKATANVAADYIVNALIQQQNKEIGKQVFPFIDGILYDESISGDKSLEQLYRELLKPKQQQKQDAPTNETGSPEANSSSGKPDDSDGNTDDPNGEDPQRSNDSGSSPSDDSDQMDADASIDPDSSGGSSGDDLSDFVGKGSSDIVPTPNSDGRQSSETIRELEETNESLLLADAISRKQNSDDGTISSRVSEQRGHKSSLNWADLLREWLTGHARSGWDSPFNASVFSSTSLVCAGRRTRAAGEIVLVIDSSGSIDQHTYDRFLFEAQCVLDELKPEALHLLSVSHVVADFKTIQYGEQVPTKLNGGGGTLFQPAFDWIESNNIQPDIVVYLTDGWSEDLRELKPVNYPLLWLTTIRDPKDFKIGDAIAIDEL